MKSLLARSLTTAVILLTLTRLAPGTETDKSTSLKFSAGFSGGTYFKIAKSMRDHIEPALEVVESKGSVENIQRIKAGEAQIGMAQVDILTNLYLYDREIKSTVKILSPVYQEEFHLVARKKIKKIKKLTGKRVSIGQVGSGTNQTSKIILATLGLTNGVVQYEQKSTADSLQALLSGEIDAFTLVAGAPVEILKGLNKKKGKKIHLLNMPKKAIKILSGKNFSYDNVKIRKRTYRWQKRKTRTIAARSLLIVRHDLSPVVVEKLVSALFKNKKKLSKIHNKWKQLNKRYTVKMLEENPHFFHPAVKQAL